jgi:hypothetical protein
VGEDWAWSNAGAIVNSRIAGHVRVFIRLKGRVETSLCHASLGHKFSGCGWWPRFQRASFPLFSTDWQRLSDGEGRFNSFGVDGFLIGQIYHMVSP